MDGLRVKTSFYSSSLQILVFKGDFLASPLGTGAAGTLCCFSPRGTCTLLVGDTEEKSHASGLMRDRDWPRKKVGKLLRGAEAHRFNFILISASGGRNCPCSVHAVVQKSLLSFWTTLSAPPTSSHAHVLHWGRWRRPFILRRWRGHVKCIPSKAPLCSGTRK